MKTIELTCKNCWDNGNLAYKRVTAVNGVVVSTIGLWKDGRGGYEPVGPGRFFETMVFNAKEIEPGKCDTCPVTISDFRDIDFNGYNDQEDARKGHDEMVREWGAK